MRAFFYTQNCMQENIVNLHVFPTCTIFLLMFLQEVYLRDFIEILMVIYIEKKSWCAAGENFRIFTRDDTIWWLLRLSDSK